MCLVGYDFGIVIDQMLFKFVYFDYFNDGCSVGVMCSMVEEMGVEVFKWQEEVIIGCFDSCLILGDINCFMLVMCGCDDQIMLLELYIEIVDVIFGVYFFIIEYCGYLVLLE